MPSKTKIHFVCRGNIFRSRVAEAYARSKMNDEWEVSSSGIEAARFPGRVLSPWAKIIGHQNGFSDWFSAESGQTSNAVLRDKDIIVFMAQDVFEDAKKRYKFNEARCVVRQVKDRQDWPKNTPLGLMRRRSGRVIKRLVNQLIDDVTHGGWVDIVDENNHELGFSMPISLANQKQLWHRSCHAIITTPGKRTLVQKRSPGIMFSPNLIDVTMGGHVDVGEIPEHAMIREIHEELGLDVKAADVRLLEIHKWSSYHRRYKRYTNFFMYSYHVLLPDDHPALTLQREEVAAMKLLSPRALHRLLRYRQLAGLGRLNYPYAFYRRLAAQIGL